MKKSSFLQFSTESPTFPHRFSTFSVQNGEKLPLIPLLFVEKGAKYFTFSTVFSTEKSV